MIRKMARAGVIAIALASTAALGSVLPAQAHTQSGPIGYTVVTTYYSNAQHSKVIGQNVQGYLGCQSDRWGSTSSYLTVKVDEGC